jgi:hypothetical protein
LRTKNNNFKFFLVYLAFSWTQVIIAQTTNIKWVVPEKDTKLPHYYVKEANGNLFTFNILNDGFKLKNVLVNVYNSKNKLIQDIDHKKWESPAWKSSDYEFQSIKNFNGQIVLVLTKQEDDRVKIYSNTLDKDYKAGKQLKLLGEFGKEKSSSSTGFFQVLFNILTYNPFSTTYVRTFDNNIKYITSKDGTKHLYYNFTYDKTGKYFEAICFSEDFKQLFKCKHLLKVFKGKADVYGEVRILNNGEILYNYGGKGEKVKRVNNLVKIYDNGRKIKVKEYDNLDDAIAIDKYTDISIDQSVLYSFYKVTPGKKKKRNNALNGFVLYEVNLNSLETKVNKESLIDEELIYKMYSDKKASKVKLEEGITDRWTLVKFVVLKDGSKLAVLEDRQVKSTTYNYTSGTSNTVVSSRTYYSYYFGDILVLKFNNDNRIDWTKVLYRRQGYYTESTLPYMGTLVVPYENDINLIYNDGGKNIQAQGYSGSDSKDKAVKAGNIKKSNAIMKTISSDGTVQSKIIFNGAVNDEIMVTSSYRTMDESTIVLNASFRKKMKFGLLKFGDFSNSSQEQLSEKTTEKVEQENANYDLPESSPEDYEVNRKTDSMRKLRGLAPLYRYPEKKEETLKTEDGIELTKEDIEKEDKIVEQREALIEDLRKKIISDNPDDYYTVQILESVEEIKQHEYFDKIKGVSNKYENGMYKYLVGNFNSEEVAIEFQSYLKRQGIEGEVIHYVNNKKVAD